jgi:Bacterial antitoxin of type II TA system, VapB
MRAAQSKTLGDPSWYTIHMKRTNLVLDESLLVQATQVLAAKTYSAAVNIALQEVIRLRKIQSIPQSFGSGIWEGDLSQMREDRARGDLGTTLRAGRSRK